MRGRKTQNEEAMNISSSQKTNSINGDVVCPTKLSFPSEEILEEIHPSAYEVVPCGTKGGCGGYRDVPP